MIEEDTTFSKIACYLHQDIKVSDGVEIQLPIHDSICLNDEKCVLLTESQCLIVNLYHSFRGEIVRIKLTEKAVKLHPLLNGFCIREKQNLRVFTSKGEWLQTVPCGSGKSELERIVLKINYPLFDLSLLGDKTLFEEVAEDELIVPSQTKQHLKLINMRTNQQKLLIISFDDQPTKVYLEDATRGICIKRQDGESYLCMVELKEGGECRKLQNIPGQHSFLRLNKFDRKRKLVLFSSYTDVFIYHYIEQKVLMQWNFTTKNIPNKISCDFSHLISIQKRGSKNIYIVHHQGIPAKKKILMNLMRSSHLIEMFPGDGLIQSLLKIVDI